MKKMRNNYLKYKNYEYSEEILKLFDVKLNNADRKRIHLVYSNYYSLGSDRGYEFIIEDLYILAYKNKLSTSQLAQIYGVTQRNIQIWLKELGLNRDLKVAASLKSNTDQLVNDNLKEATNTPLSLINENYSKFPFYMVDFINYLATIKGKSPNTIEGYTHDLTILFRFLKAYKGLVKDTTIDFEEIEINDLDKTFINNVTLTDIYAFLSFVEKQRGNGTYARARKVACLKSFFKFLNGKARIITDNPTLELESPKISKRHPIYLTLDESVTLLSSLNKEDKNYKRDYCILTLFLNCGMRLSELCSIRIDKIKEDILTIIGKGNKERTVYLNNACMKAMDSYLNSRDCEKVSEENKKYLFLSNRGLPINKRTVELLVKKHIGEAGMENGQYTPHKLRHTAATLMYKHGKVDIRSLQSILGHENISTTQIYTHIDDDALRGAVKANPLSDL